MTNIDKLTTRVAKGRACSSKIRAIERRKDLRKASARYVKSKK